MFEAIQNEVEILDLLEQVRSEYGGLVYTASSRTSFEIACASLSNYLGIWLVRAGSGGNRAPREKRDLEFGLSTTGESSGLFARSDDEIWLMHSGRVHPNRPSFQLKPQISVRLSDGRTRFFFQVARLGSQSFIENISEFGDLSRRVDRSAAQPIITNIRTNNDDAGPAEGGLRSEAIWEARHSPLVHKIVAVLDKLQCRDTAGLGWHPDLIRMTPSEKTIIVEVKPDAGHHNVITAIGQSICYRSGVSQPISVIAAPGIGRLSETLAKVLESCQLHAVDLDGDVLEQFAILVGSG